MNDLIREVIEEELSFSMFETVLRDIGGLDGLAASGRSELFALIIENYAFENRELLDYFIDNIDDDELISYRDSKDFPTIVEYFLDIEDYDTLKNSTVYTNYIKDCSIDSLKFIIGYNRDSVNLVLDIREVDLDDYESLENMFSNSSESKLQEFFETIFQKSNIKAKDNNDILLFTALNSNKFELAEYFLKQDGVDLNDDSNYICKELILNSNDEALNYLVDNNHLTIGEFFSDSETTHSYYPSTAYPPWTGSNDFLPNSISIFKVLVEQGNLDIITKFDIDFFNSNLLEDEEYADMSVLDIIINHDPSFVEKLKSHQPILDKINSFKLDIESIANNSELDDSTKSRLQYESLTSYKEFKDRYPLLISDDKTLNQTDIAL